MKIHFIGIGGIGISALAKYYLLSRAPKKFSNEILTGKVSSGIQISGSDLQNSVVIEGLKKLGAKIYLGHQAKNLSLETDLVIYSAAVPSNNPELKEAKSRKIKCQTYAEALGDLTKKYFTIAVSGMHGKSTTTAMVALILVEAGFDPTLIVGTKLREFGDSNFRLGKSKYLVIEADEWNASFLNYWPKIIVLTNIEEEHLDYYKDLNHILRTFKKYIGHLPKDGILVANGDDKNISKIKNQKPKIRCKIQNYFLKQKEAGILRKILKIPGEYNVANALAALTVARTLKIDDKISFKALNNFKGAWRRMEYKGTVNGAKIFDDYGHHPTEIKVTLGAARELLFERSAEGAKSKATKDPSTSSGYNRRRLWCVFQPHQYQRTYKLFNQFVGAFEKADKVILLPIYSVAGREKESIKRKVSSEMLTKAINKRYQAGVRQTGVQVLTCNNKYTLKSELQKKVIYLNSFEKTANYLRKNLKKGDIAVIMGAGDIWKLTERLIHS